MKNRELCDVALFSLFLMSLSLVGLALADSTTTQSNPPVASVRTVEISPIAMTYRDLDTVLGDIGHMVQADATSIPGRLELSIEGKSDSGEQIGLQLHTWGKLPAGGYLPPVATTVSLDYHVIDSAAISSVELILNDPIRQIKIVGTDRVRVESAAAAIQAKFSEYYYSLPIAGQRLRFALFCMGVVVTLALISWVTGKVTLDRPALYVSSWFGIYAVFMGLIFFLPWQLWLPGAAIYNDSASFLTRHQDAIGLISLIASLVPIALEGYRRIKNRHGDPTT